MRARTPISVILSTYNWSSALRCALRSVQLQTLADFEVLVIGDGCTDDSRQVVDSFQDARFKWNNLPRNYGSQWAPNNRGLELAEGVWVAYLGQDDIWHPRHLEACLATAAQKQADLVASVAIMYGPPGSGFRAVTGVLVDDVYSPRDFMPPSSIAHARSLVERMGFWKSHLETPMPVDWAFLKAAADAGARIASTGELTVFKFNAAWRRDSYLLKPIEEQETMLKRIEAGRDFRQDELIGVLQAVVSDRLIRMEMSVPAAPSMSGAHRRNSRYKGAERRYDTAELIVADETRRFQVEEPSVFEWHDEETHPVFGAFRWSGPNARATISLPILVDRALLVKIHLIAAIDAEAMNSIKVFAQSEEVEFASETTPEMTRLITFLVQPTKVKKAHDNLNLALQIGKTRRSLDVGTNTDRRWLGLAVNWVEIGPARH